MYTTKVERPGGRKVNTENMRKTPFRPKPALHLLADILVAASAAILALGEEKEERMQKPDILSNVRKIVFIGDSLTDGSSYPDYVMNTLDECFPDASFEMANAGVCGNTAADLRKRLEADVLARKPDLVVVAIGTNDAWQNRPAGSFRDDMDNILRALVERSIKVIVVLPSPFGDPAREEKFLAYLQTLRETASKYHARIADAHALFLEWQKAGREVLGPDGVHHGRDGFEAMARAVLDGLGMSNIPVRMVVKSWPGLITEWETSDPVERDGSYDPSEAKGWRKFDRKALMSAQTWWNVPFAERGAWMPFPEANEKQVAYGRAFFDAPRAAEYEMRIGGSPAPQIVWINGRKVWEARAPHGYHPDADRTAVGLPAGRSEIIVVSNYMVFLGFYEPERKREVEHGRDMVTPLRGFVV